MLWNRHRITSSIAKIQHLMTKLVIFVPVSNRFHSLTDAFLFYDQGIKVQTGMIH
jgi:hypothetical protein